MLLDVIDQVSEARRVRLASNPNEPFGSVVMIVCNEGSLCVLTQKEDQWTELRSRTDLYTDDMAPVLDIVMPLMRPAIAAAGLKLRAVRRNSRLPLWSAFHALTRLTSGHSARSIT